LSRRLLLTSRKGGDVKHTFTGGLWQDMDVFRPLAQRKDSSIVMVTIHAYADTMIRRDSTCILNHGKKSLIHIILLFTVGVVGGCLVQVPAPACCVIITGENFRSLSVPLLVSLSLCSYL